MTGLESYIGGSPLIAFGAAFGAGILAGLSPCVYLMIPIVSAYVGADSIRDRILCENCGPVSIVAYDTVHSPLKKTPARSFLLSFAYVTGMAAVYSLLGMIAALTGNLFGSIATSPWALLFVANMLILFALIILEVIPFPVWFQRGLLKPAQRGVFGAVLIGAVSGLVASPCTSPVLLALLTYVATTRSVVYGGTLLFSFSMGMGILLIVAGTFTGLAAALPKPGGWMTGAKKLLGALILGLAEYYLILAGQAWF